MTTPTTRLVKIDDRGTRRELELRGQDGTLHVQMTRRPLDGQDVHTVAVELTPADVDRLRDALDAFMQ